MWAEILNHWKLEGVAPEASAVEAVLSAAQITAATEALWGRAYQRVEAGHLPPGMSLAEALAAEVVLVTEDGEARMVASPEGAGSERADIAALGDGIAIRSALLAEALPRAEAGAAEGERRTLVGGAGAQPMDAALAILLEDALAAEATDIHLRPGRRLGIYYRKQGRLYLRWSLPAERYGPLANRLKLLGDMNIAERLLPQDGQFLYKRAEGDVAVRLAALGTVAGEKLVLRLLPQWRRFREPEALGLSPALLVRLRRLLRRERGLVVLSGPTNSGKTTLLYALLEELARERHIYSIEDPIEAPLAGVEQIECNILRGVDYQTGLRGLLRLDPEVLMIGELRDGESAAMAVRAALTGALVVTTLHCGDAQEAVSRLADLGVSRELLATTLLATSHQRLMPGGDGLVLVQELWQPDRSELEAIRRGDGPLALREAALAKGFRSLLQEGERLAAEGRLAPEALARLREEANDGAF